MSTNSQDLNNMEKSIRTSFQLVEDIILSPTPLSASLAKKSLNALKDNIRSLLHFAQYLQSYGDKSYISAISAKKEVQRLKVEIAKGEQRITEFKNDILLLKDQLFQKGLEIQRLEKVIKLDAPFTSSVEFKSPILTADTSFDSIDADFEDSFKINSYYSESTEISDKDLETKNIQTPCLMDLMKQLDLVALGELRSLQDN